MYNLDRSMSSLDVELQRVAGAKPLLVAIDFDGTLAPIVQRPDLARPIDGVEGALIALASTGATVALLSGRSLDDLRSRAEPPGGVLLVGGHGTEWPGEELEVDGELHQRLVEELESIADQAPEAFLEIKQHSVALHVRRVDPVTAARLVNEVLDGPGSWPGLRATLGKRVVEVSLTEIDKGTALNRLRVEHQAEAVVYIGDDTSDEDAFAVLRPGDVAIKVGEGVSLAAHRVSSPAEVVTVLETLAELRAASPNLDSP
jgi:trehalose 6-phosphate phosphatase